MRGVEIGGGVSYLCGFLPPGAKAVICPVPGCPEVLHSADWLRENFMYRPFFAWIAAVQEGREPLPICDLYAMHIPAGRLIKNQ